MYQRKVFESTVELLRWLNNSSIVSEDIISIMPFETEQIPSGYEIIYTAGKYQNINHNVKEKNVTSLMVDTRNLAAELDLTRKKEAKTGIMISSLERELANEKSLRKAAEKRVRELKERSWWERLIRKGE